MHSENGQEVDQHIDGFSKKKIFCGNQKLMSLISYNILFTQSLLSENAIRGYVYDVSKVNLVKNRKTKYFNFIWQTEKDIRNCVSFSSKKRDFLVNISNESSQHIGVEIKKFKPSTKFNDLQMINLDITKISTIINETGLNEIVHIEGVLFYLKEE